MGTFVADILFMLIALGLGWYLFGKRLDEKKRARFTMIISLVSYFVYKTFWRAVIASGGDFWLAYAAGFAFGFIVLLIGWGIRILVNKIKRP